MYKPFPRQQEAIDKMVSFINSKTSRKGIFVYPVAFGKSIVIANVASQFPDKYFINICPNKELTQQNYDKYCSYGYEASICSASLGKNEIGKVMFATIGTLKKHLNFFKDKEVVILNDECQNSSLKGSQLDKFIKGIKKCKVVGTTGTPVRLDSGMNGSELKMMNRMRKCFYTSIEDIVQIHEIIKDKRWSKLIYEVEDVDERFLELNTQGTEYTVESLKKFSEDNDLIGKAEESVDRLLKEGRKSVLVYMPFIEDAERLKARIKGTEVLHSKINNKKRTQIIDDFKSGKLKVLINCLILVEGFDYPELSSIVMARPTNSINQYYQAIGRITRIHPNKKDGKIIDISGNFNKFGKVEDLVFENVPYYGWGLFNGNGELLTNYPLKAKVRPTRESLMKRGKTEATRKEQKKNPEITWGMWRGRKFWDIVRDPKDSRRFRGWAAWMYDEYKKGRWKFRGENGNDIRVAMENYLKVEDKKVKLPF